MDSAFQMNDKSTFHMHSIYAQHPQNNKFVYDKHENATPVNKFKYFALIVIVSYFPR